MSGGGSRGDHLLRGAGPRQGVVGQLAAAQLRRAGGSAVKLVREETNINMTLNFDFVLRAVDSLIADSP